MNDHRILPHEKRSLSQAGKNLRTSSVEEVTDDGKTQLRGCSLMQKNDFTMSQKEFDKKSQMMRLSELDSVSNHLQNKSEKDEVIRTQVFGKLPTDKKIQGVSELGQQRNRAPSEN